MNFEREYISSSDESLFNQFEMYDYDKQIICKWREGYNWLVEREQEIYFVHVGGSGNLEQAPQQYDLIWKGKKIVIFKDNYSSYHCWNLLGIDAPIELKEYESELIELINIVLEENHRVNICRSGLIYHNEKFTVNNFKITYRDNVR